MTTISNRWIEKHAGGGSFVDVGGLFKIKGEKVSVAARAGASPVTMVDLTPLANKKWTELDEHCRERGVTDVRHLCTDATARQFAREVGQYNLVHCSGLLYHMPDPMNLLVNLRRITAGMLIVSSVVIPPEIRNASGTLITTPSQARFIPGLGEEERRILEEHFSASDLRVFGIHRPVTEGWYNPKDKANFGPWWWFFTPQLMKRMLEVARLEIIDEGYVRDPVSYAFLCRKSEA